MMIKKKIEINYKSAFLWMVIAPFLTVSIYYLFIVSDRYVSEAKLSVKQTGEENGASLPVLGFFSGGNSLVKEDNIFLKEYIHSFDMLDYLDRSLDLRMSYQEKNIDFISRLSPKASREDFLDYYRRHVDVYYDESSSVITLKVQAFDPNFARQVNQAIIEESERFINAISHKIATEQMLFIEDELAKAKDRLQASTGKMLSFQDKYHVIDPVEQAKATAAFITQMESNLAASEAEIRNLMTYLNEDSYQVIAMKNKIESLRQQIIKEKVRIASSGNNNRLNEISAKFSDIQIDVDFLTDIYKTSLTAMEKTRIDAAKKLKNLVVIASANLPEEAAYPRKAYILTIIFIALNLVFGISRLIIAIIKEHKE